MSKLEALVKQVTIHDIGLQRSPSLFPNLIGAPSQEITEIEDRLHTTEPRYESTERASITYIGVYENCDISVGIFVVNGKSGLPLHNHPGMHGMIKVVHGSLMLSCYDKLPLFSISPQNELIPKALMNRLDLIERGCVVPVKPRVSNTIITPSSTPNFLNP